MMCRQILTVSLSVCFAAAALVLIGGTNSPCSAGIISPPAAVPLSTLVNNPTATYTVGDKIFSNFSYLSTGDMPSAAGVNVAAILDSSNNFGIEFQGAFVDLPSSPGGSDAKIEYHVAVADPTKFLISDAHLAGNPVLLGTAGSISVTETFLPLGPGGEHTMKIFADESAGSKLTDLTNFTPAVAGLDVQKDILVIATPASQTVTMSFVDQSFSQIKVPESSTILLSLIGIVGLGIFMRQLDVRNSGRNSQT
jgi:hypothetical protein